MSEENVEVVRGVRTPITVSPEARPRTLDERVLVRFPALARPLGFVWSRLPPRSRLRRAMNARLMRQAQEAAIRRDFELLFLRFDPEIEFEMAENPAFGFVAPDAVGVHRGREGYRRVFQLVTEAWEDLKFEPDEVVDFGDKLLTAGRITGHARHTKIALDAPLFQLVTVRGGLVVRQRDFMDREKALEAAGLRG
jgi:ketosteroid isomerase-like protein